MIQKLCSFIFHSLLGWKVDPFPDKKQYVMIVAPHTSNWDFIIGLFARGTVNVQLSFLAKSQLFKFPWGSFFRYVGGISVDRSQSNKLVDQIAENFHNDPNFKLVLTPEGTRRSVNKWKSGFHYIAQAAQVPIVPDGLDFKHKHMIVGEPFMPTAELSETLEKIQKFYEDVQGKHPQGLPKI